MKKKVETYTALKRRILALVLGLWLLLMVLITLGGAQDVIRQIQPEAWDYLTTYAKSPLNYSETNAALPGYRQYGYQFHVGWVRHEIDLDLSFPFALQRFSSGIVPDELDLGYETAMIYWDDKGDLAKSGDVLYFPYMTAETWKKSESERKIDGYAVVDLTTFPEGKIIAKHIGTGPYHGEMVFPLYDIRMKGYFEGEQFYPVRVDLLYTAFPGSQDWKTEFEREVPPGAKLEYIFATNGARGFRFEKNPVTVNGVRYDSLTDALDAWRQEPRQTREAEVSGWTNYVLFLRHAFTDDSGQLIHVALAARCNPLLYSVTALWPVYVVTLAILAAMVALLIFKIRRELTEPVRQVNLVARGLSLPEGKSYEPRWQEPYELERIVKDTQQALQEAKAEARQLQTQLEYAKNAEEYRRRMISGLTHELKTPLAVIHSYAEGLQEGIAQEKKEQYLGVILEESEKMDAMVLQMLDLSRLEAGKVKLAADNFSLAALTRSVFDRMMPLAQEKGLTVRFTMPNECRLTADEGRITQVVTNLASNAIKYTPEGGEISVIVYRKNDTNILCVENTCERLSQEALEKVFDSFYRGDDARTTEGTGLGLAIVKAIVEQHGGSCRAFNTPTGVQFQVILP